MTPATNNTATPWSVLLEQLLANPKITEALTSLGPIGPVLAREGGQKAVEILESLSGGDRAAGIEQLRRISTDAEWTVIAAHLAATANQDQAIAVARRDAILKAGAQAMISLLLTLL